MSANPFIEKARRERPTARALAQRNYDELASLLSRFTDADRPETRQRIAKRVTEARKALEKTSRT